MSLSSAPSADPQAAVRALLDRLIATGRTAGLQYLLLRDGMAPLEHCAGWSDALAARPVTPATTFNLYSITKPFTAALVLELARRGAFRLEDRIAHATGRPGLSRLGTVRETLLHRAGFANPMPLRWFHLDDEDAGFDEAAFVARVLGAEALHAPRTPRYSNPGYLALGAAIERALGLRFRTALATQLLAALPLAQDGHLGFTAPQAQAHALGHLPRFGLLDLALGWLVQRGRIEARREARWVQLRHHHVDGSAYGGLIGNARGAARFGQAVLGLVEGIDPQVRRELLTVVATPGARATRSLGWFSDRLRGEPWFAHAGGGIGGYGELRLYPELRAVSVLLTNAAGLSDRRALDAIDAAWLRIP